MRAEFHAGRESGVPPGQEAYQFLRSSAKVTRMGVGGARLLIETYLSLLSVASFASSARGSSTNPRKFAVPAIAYSRTAVAILCVRQYPVRLPLPWAVLHRLPLGSRGPGRLPLESLRPDWRLRNKSRTPRVRLLWRSRH